MPVKQKFLIVAFCFAVASFAIAYVTFSMSTFWLLIPGSLGVAIFGPWSYYLYAKLKGKPEVSHEEILAQTRIELKLKDKK